MKHQIVVPVFLLFNRDGSMSADIPDTNKVPWSMLLENMNNLQKGMAQQCVREAYGDDIPDDQIEDYLQGMINLDREKLKELFK